MPHCGAIIWPLKHVTLTTVQYSSWRPLFHHITLYCNRIQANREKNKCCAVTWFSWTHSAIAWMCVGVGWRGGGGDGGGGGGASWNHIELFSLTYMHAILSNLIPLAYSISSAIKWHKPLLMYLSTCDFFYRIEDEDEIISCVYVTALCESIQKPPGWCITIQAL